MARGEAYVRCPHCGYQSRIPVMALQRDNYHCSQCGHRIPLANVNLSADNQAPQPFRSRTKSQFQRHKRRQGLSMNSLCILAQAPGFSEPLRRAFRIYAMFKDQSDHLVRKDRS